MEGNPTINKILHLFSRLSITETVQLKNFAFFHIIFHCAERFIWIIIFANKENQIAPLHMFDVILIGANTVQQAHPSSINS